MHDKKITIEFLRKNGWKVRVLHERKKNTNHVVKLSGEQFSPKGGKTVIEITSPDEKINAVGISYCADSDHFDRKMGNMIALGRAWKNAMYLIKNKIKTS